MSGVFGMSSGSAPTEQARRGWGELARRHGLSGLLVLLVAALVALSWLLAPRPQGSDQATFAGTDSQVTAILQEAGTTPWFTPLLKPGSSEVESGLFAAQAALGGAILGYVLGRLRSRRGERVEQARSSRPETTATSAPATGTGPAGVDRSRMESTSAHRTPADRAWTGSKGAGGSTSMADEGTTSRAGQGA